MGVVVTIDAQRCNPQTLDRFINQSSVKYIIIDKEIQNLQTCDTNSSPTFTTSTSPIVNVPILPRILPPPIYIHACQYRNSEPYHDHEEEKRVADVSRHVCNQSDYQRAEEGARL